MNLSLPPDFNHIAYSNRYLDLKKAFGQNQALLEKHQVEHGMREGRLCHFESFMVGQIDNHLIGNWCNEFVWNQSLEIIPQSNDWLSTIAHLPWTSSQLAHIYSCFHKVKTTEATLKIDDECIWGINPFFRGTVHGYAFIFKLIHDYKDSDKKVVLAKDSQSGILDLCQKAFGDRIIYLDSKNTIRCPRFYFVQDVPHILASHEVMNTIMPLLRAPHVSQPSSSVMVLKTNQSLNISHQFGVVTEQEIKSWNIPTRFQRLFPEKMNEIDFARFIQTCTDLIVSWCSAHTKAIMQLTEGHQCQNLHVIVAREQIGQYQCALNENDILHPAILYPTVPNIRQYICNGKPLNLSHV